MLTILGRTLRPPTSTLTSTLRHITSTPAPSQILSPTCIQAHRFSYSGLQAPSSRETGKDRSFKTLSHRDHSVGEEDVAEWVFSDYQTARSEGYIHDYAPPHVPRQKGPNEPNQKKLNEKKNEGGKRAGWRKPDAETNGKAKGKGKGMGKLAAKARKAWEPRIARDTRTGANAWRVASARVDAEAVGIAVDGGVESGMRGGVLPVEEGEQQVDQEGVDGEYSTNHQTNDEKLEPSLSSPSLSTTYPSASHSHAFRYPFIAMTLAIDPVGLPPSLNSELYRMGFRYQYQTLFRKRSNTLSWLLKRIGHLVHLEYLTAQDCMRRKVENFEKIQRNARRRKEGEVVARREAMEEDAKVVDGFL